MNDTAKRYKVKLEKLVKKAGDRMNACESHLSTAWLKYNNFSLLQRRSIDAWLCKYELAGADPHYFKPFTVEKQSAGGYELCYLKKNGERDTIIPDMTKKDADILYAFLNDYRDELRKALNRKG